MTSKEQELREKWENYARNSFPEPIPHDEKILSLSVDWKDAEAFFLSARKSELEDIKREIVENHIKAIKIPYTYAYQELSPEQIAFGKGLNIATSIIKDHMK